MIRLSASVHASVGTVAVHMFVKRFHAIGIAKI